jgi:hydrogenase assembly chaperone HypC/HupF
MCVMAPGRVIAVEPDSVVVDIVGMRRRAMALLEPGLQPGDWVLIAAGAVVRRIGSDQAADIERALDALRPRNTEGARP